MRTAAAAGCHPEPCVIIWLGAATATCCCYCCFFLLQVSSSLADKVHDSYILKEVTGSDHVPLGLVLKKA
jgi:hypothetical protein